MKFSKNLFISLIVLFLSFSIIKPIDLPAFYRTTEQQGIPKYDVDDWTTFIEARYRSGSTRNGFNGSDNTTSILNIYGLVDVNNLAMNLEGLTASSKPTTWYCLNENSAAGQRGTIPQLNFTGNNGKIKLTGKATINEFNVEFQQNLFNGVFVRGLIPFRSVKVNNIGYTDQTMTWTTGYTTFDNFMTNSFDTVLDENGYLPLLTTFKKSSVGDINLCVGWQGYGKNVLKHLKDLFGYVELGVVLPIAQEKKLDNVAAVPIGYNGHIGVDGRFSLNVKPFKMLDLGFHGEAIILFGNQQQIRLKTDKTQSGIIILEKGNADVNPGTIWGVGVNATFTPFLKGLFFRGSYSFTRQEQTILTIKDDNYLKTVLQGETRTTVDQTSQNDVANSDDQLQAWNQHAIHAQFGFDVRAQTNAKVAPKFFVSYDYPFYGKRSWKTDMIGGTIGLNVTWDF